MTDDYVANLRKGVARIGLVSLCLEDFAARVLAEGMHRAPISDAAISAIRAQCILGLKNSHAAGLSIDDEAEVLRQAFNELEKRLDAIIASGREGANP